MTVEEALKRVEVSSQGRTRYEGREPRVDEVLAAEVRRLQKLLHWIAESPQAMREPACAVGIARQAFDGEDIQLAADATRRDDANASADSRSTT